MASIPMIQPTFTPSPNILEPQPLQSLIATLAMMTHIEGGYFVETDRDPLLIPSPFPQDTSYSSEASELVPQRPGFDPLVRNASTSIFYLLTPSNPQGNFHRNRARTVHTLHRGRGIYVLIHADEPDVEYEGGGGTGKRIEVFTVGPDVARGERLQWIVEGGKYKASFLLADSDDAGGKARDSAGLLITETVVPGFEYGDHDFLHREGLEALIGAREAEKLAWLIRKS